MTTSTTYTRLDSGGGVPAHAARAIADVAAGNGLVDVPVRRLDQAELLALAASVAARPEQWREHLRFPGTDDPADDTGRHYVCLSRDEHVDVWLLCWTPADDTGWHDHDVSSGAVAVAQGRLVEHNLGVGRPEVRTEVPAGQVYSFGPDHIHRLSGLDDASVSIHVYSPPLQTMGQYVVDDHGVLHRTSVTYAEELRALAEVPA
ncbi:Cysteine dioxygenase type I [Jatrophihabitans endophyticus]|uniref:Cysteine dioxygenase type I n=1 Tax=Jatrophihabitans endophyticus TaxID=1206085 RepID=A0A1M5QA23_9ACTN|nr:cysteine dioxygenase family protein [Jatrophihabitans endophyticus]SHH10882.1 Cysteine dioxygenase type I [Jatrophihabitans endophyticus]